jgi:hypothetical protein
MALERDTTEDGTGKYALIRLDKMRADGLATEDLTKSLGPLVKYLEFGEKGHQMSFL